MRVITGKARGRKLITVEGTDVVRPTADNVKEAIFSAIQFELEGRTVLDMFAGSGQLGIEALSRGAAECWFVDSAAVSIKAIRENLKSTGLEGAAHVVNMPFSAFLKCAVADGTKIPRFDIALLDPPYGHGLLKKALPLLAGKMSENGVIICEHERELTLPGETDGFYAAKVLRHGRICVTIYRRLMEEQGDENGNLSGEL